jgi:hypothetical protein
MAKTNPEQARSKAYNDEREGKPFEKPNDAFDHLFASQGEEHRKMIETDAAARAGRDEARKDKDR